MTQRWLTIYTKPQAIGRVCLGVEASGWKAFCPFEVVRYRDRGISYRKILPLFGQYLFVWMEPERSGQIIEVEGVEGVYRDTFSGKPRYAIEEELERVRRLRDMGAFDRTREDWARAGEDVLLADSAMRGLAAKIKSAKRHKRVELVVEGAPFRVTTSIDKIEKVRA